MGVGKTDQLSATIAVLGLLAEKPDTVGGLSARLQERFRTARFARNAAHNSIELLERRRLVEKQRDGSTATRLLYRPTERGLEELRSWQRSYSGAAAPQRDGLHARLSFAEQDELRGLLASVEEELTNTIDEYNRVREDARWFDGGRRRGAGWEERMALLLLDDEAAIWLGRMRRLQRLQQTLEAVIFELRAV